MALARSGYALGLFLSLLSGSPTWAQSVPPAEDVEPDQPVMDQALNRQLWETIKHSPYEQARFHIAQRQREERTRPSNDIVLPTGWQIAPAGRQVAVGRFPYEAVVYAGQVIVLNTGYYARTPADVSVVNPETGEVVRVLHPGALFPSAQPGKDGDLYLSGGISQKVYRYNKRFEAVREYAVEGYVGSLAAIDRTHLALTYLVASPNQADFQAGKYQQGKLAILNTLTGAIEHSVEIGYFPYAVRFHRGKLYVTLLGENKLRIYDVQSNLLKTLAVGKTPQGIATDGERLYVVNTGSDSISVVDTRQDTLRTTFRLQRTGTTFGGAPTSCAVEGDRLYITQANSNQITVVDKQTGKRFGAIPTGWYPTRVLFDAKRMLVVSAKGIRARRPNVDGPQAVENQSGPEYVLTLLKGSLGIVPRATLQARLPSWTRQADRGIPLFAPRRGQKLPIRHIFYIIRENRTYDQVLGDIPRANGDPFLTLFGRHVTPNGHRLADTFVTLDNYYADGEISVLGHSFTTSGYASPFLEWIGNARYSGHYTGYPFGMVPAVTSPAYLWDALDKQGIDYRIYGENYFLYTRAYDLFKEAFGPESALTQKFYAQMMTLASKTDRGNLFYQFASAFYGQADTREDALRLLDNTEFTQQLSLFLCGDDSLATALGQQSALRRKFADYLSHYPFNYRSWDLAFSDLDRVRAWKSDFEKQLQRGQVAQLHYIWLPNDHTGGSQNTPFQLVAQNDAALGILVETISHSRIWNQSLILVTEDDAQDGPDHVDATRTVALAAGPYVKRGAIIHDRYDQLSLLRTIEVLLGCSPINQNDALAVPMFSLFTDRPDNTPYSPAQPSDQLADADRMRYRDLEGQR